MTLDTITQHVELVTKVQSLCRLAKATKCRSIYVRLAAAMDEVNVSKILPGVRADLQAAFRNAFSALECAA
jgi:hypothetical protein